VEQGVMSAFSTLVSGLRKILKSFYVKIDETRSWQRGIDKNKERKKKNSTPMFEKNYL